MWSSNEGLGLQLLMWECEGMLGVDGNGKLPSNYARSALQPRKEDHAE